MEPLAEGGEGSYLPNCQTNLFIGFYTVSLLFCKFIKTTAHYLGRYEPLSHVRCPAPRRTKSNLKSVKYYFEGGGDFANVAR